MGDLHLQSSAAQPSRNVRRAAVPAVRAISARLAKGVADLQRKAGVNRLSISRRLILLLLALALPLNLVVVGVIRDLVSRANEMQRTSLMFAARSIAAGVDSELGTYVALAEALSRSPALLNDHIHAFEAEARRAFPAGGHTPVVLSDADGLQLINTFFEPGQPLPRRRPPEAIAAMHRAFSTRSIAITDLVKSPVSPRWFVTIQVPIFKDGVPFRGLGIIMTQEAFLRLLNAQDIPKNWRAGIIDGQGRYIARVPHEEVGQLASPGWRAIKDQTGLFEFVSSEGDALIQANAHPSASNWKVGVAVKKAELRQAAWMTCAGRCGQLSQNPSGFKTARAKAPGNLPCPAQVVAVWIQPRSQPKLGPGGSTRRTFRRSSSRCTEIPKRGIFRARSAPGQPADRAGLGLSKR